MHYFIYSIKILPEITGSCKKQEKLWSSGELRTLEWLGWEQPSLDKKSVRIQLKCRLCLHSRPERRHNRKTCGAINLLIFPILVNTCWHLIYGIVNCLILHISAAFTEVQDLYIAVKTEPTVSKNATGKKRLKSASGSEGSPETDFISGNTDVPFLCWQTT